MRAASLLAPAASRTTHAIPRAKLVALGRSCPRLATRAPRHHLQERSNAHGDVWHHGVEKERAQAVVIVVLPWRRRGRRASGSEAHRAQVGGVERCGLGREREARGSASRPCRCRTFAAVVPDVRCSHSPPPRDTNNSGVELAFAGSWRCLRRHHRPLCAPRLSSTARQAPPTSPLLATPAARKRQTSRRLPPSLASSTSTCDAAYSLPEHVRGREREKE